MTARLALAVFTTAANLIAVVPSAIPAGANLEIRLTTPVSSSTSHVKDKMEALLIAPVLVEGQTVLAAGSILHGSVAAVSAATEEKDALLRLQFTGLTAANHQYTITSRVYSVDNVRETVGGEGVVQGISVKDTITGRMDQGLDKLGGSRYAGLARILETAKGVLLKNADPNIAYDAGTEMTLRLTKPLSLEASAAAPAPKPVPDNGRLTELVQNQPWQTYAASPPRPSDVTNLLFIGEFSRITAAFEEAGWVGSQALSGESKFETARAIIEQRGYREAPVSIILLDNNPPELVLQKANNTFASRHHLRIWQSPDTYEGKPVWLCAATHDTGIDYSDREKTFIHKIDSNIDLERLKVTNDLLLTGKVQGVTLIDRGSVPTNFRNGTGDDVSTDARIAVLLF